MEMRICLVLLVAVLELPLAAADTAGASVERLLDRMVEREKAFLAAMSQRSPLIETYVQETPESAPADAHPTKDHYFLGRFRLGDTVAYEPLVGRSDTPPAPKTGFKLLSFHGLPIHPLPFHAEPKGQPLIFLPRGFAQMSVIDLHEFNRQTYKFDYVRREFLGEVRCLVFDVSPARAEEPGRFVGRIWVEDRDESIVRFNGTYWRAAAAKGSKDTAHERYFHFDSWRVSVAPGVWAPAQIYVEEDQAGQDKTGPAPARFKAQTRIWDYAAAGGHKLEELTDILVESDAAVKDQSASKDISPLESQRSWERQAEENLLERLEKGGLVAPSSPVDEVLNTVVNNLIVSGNLNVEAHCRVLLTTPLETFSIGHTIVISRGLIDVLPDEASLALMLADELAHIALGHPTPTQFAFRNQTMLSDAELLQRFRFQRSSEELASAGKKTIELMRVSPYQKTANVGLFLKSVASRAAVLPRLLQANLGNQVANADSLNRLAEFAATAPALEEDKLDQIAALPLGSRVKLNPWDNQIVLVKTRPVALLSPREKMPFEVTPFVLYLTRFESGPPSVPTGMPTAAKELPAANGHQ
jgi:hypothetical protein